MKKILYVVIIILIGIFVYYFYSRNINNLGKKAINVLKNDIKNNGIIIDNAKFFRLEELSNNIDFSNCQNGSGILVTNEQNNYVYEDFMKCSNYQSTINKKRIEGPEVIILNRDEKYIEFTSLEEASSKEIDDVNIIYYKLQNDLVKRAIIYTDNKTININGNFNNAFATINLTDGDITVTEGESFRDPGYFAYDSIDENINDKVKIIGDVNTNQVGEYLIHYIVINSRNNYSSISRKVTVKRKKDYELTGTCVANVRSNAVNIEVTTTESDKIINYEYIVNGKSSSSSSNSFTYSDTFTKENLPKVSVKITDKDMDNLEIDCTVEDKFSLNVVKDVNGYDCLEGFVCYKQKDYNTTYQATSDGPGPLSRNGCLPTSMSIIAAGFGLKSSNGELYTPPTLVNEIIYPDGKIWGYSEYPRVVYIANQLNLKVSEKYHRKDVDVLKNELRKGNLIILAVNGGCYSTGSHYLTVIGINDQDLIFVADPYSKTNSSMTGICTVNNWVTIDEFINKGQPNYFAVISKQ